jgi:uncharacterized protein (TIGR03437 family)
MKFFPVAALLLQPILAQAPPLRVVNAASAVADDLTPGAQISIFGSNLANTTASAPPAAPDSVLAGVSVKIGGVPAGLLYVSPAQINAVIDPSTPVGPATLSVASPTLNGAGAAVNIRSRAAPGLYAASGAGSREGAILNAVTFAGGPFSVTTGGTPTYLALYATGLDLSSAPNVTIGGLPATVQYYGPAPCCLGMEQINIVAPAALAGAGRVDVLAASGGMSSNVVEAVILPNAGAGPFPPPGENMARSREIGAIAYVPTLGQTLVLDEQDDVIRVIDMKQRTVVRTIALASGAQPFAVAVNDVGATAVVAERARAKVAFVRLSDGVVISEIPVDPGPAAVAIDGDTVVVASQDADTVSVISLTARQVLAAVPVGRGPRSVAIDDASFRAYVANQSAGTVSVIDLAKRAVVDTLQLGANARPQAVRLLPAGGLLAVTEPDAGTIDFLDLTSKAIYKAQATATDLAFEGSNAYFASQTGAAATIAPVLTAASGVSLGGSATVPLDMGLRGVAVDPVDHLLLVSSESSGAVSLIDLTTNRAAGSINAVRGEHETVAQDDRSDRATAGNTPVITSLAPVQSAAGSNVQLTVNGTDLAGTFSVFFAAPDGSSDPALSISNVAVESTGQQITLTLQIAAGAAQGNHVLRVFTPNGESSTAAGAGNVLTVL